MEILTEIEIRVLGSLVEKEITTPEYYPLTLNALRNACNQKSNREPIVDYDGQAVGSALESLKTHGIVRTMMGGDSRVPKYKHYFGEAYAVNALETAVLNVLMLRGPQTVGELRTRTDRLYVAVDPRDIEVALEGLMTRSEGVLVVKLPRSAGQKEFRYAHLLSGAPVIPDAYSEIRESAPSTHERLLQLENEVVALHQLVEALQSELTDVRRLFD